MKKKTVGIIGLGYVGLPLARVFFDAGYTVTGFDVDRAKVSALNRGCSYIGHIDNNTIKSMVKTGRFKATTDFKKLGKPDALLICVPTPLTPSKEPELKYVVNTAESIAKTLRRGQLIVLESTTYPGTTSEVVKPILEASGLKCEKDFFLAFSPEREDPGNAMYSTKTIPKIVGGIGKRSRDAACALYSSTKIEVVPVSSCETAEASKLLENIYRCVNIALVNELKVLFERMDIDVWEVIRAASTKPFGFHPFYPGPGLGGHCIPIDPFYLSWRSRQFDLTTKFIELAGEINTSMPYYVAGRISEALNEHGKSVNGAKILVLGVAYKKDVDDMRESPALRLIQILKENKAKVSYHDPHIPALQKTRQYDFHMRSRKLTAALLKQQDCVVIVTDHSAIDYQWVVDKAKLVVDTRNATEKVRRGKSRIRKA
ncbi:nucleotide sugar dehydrogenase [Planctomycetota bacterium]